MLSNISKPLVEVKLKVICCGTIDHFWHFFNEVIEVHKLFLCNLTLQLNKHFNNPT